MKAPDNRYPAFDTSRLALLPLSRRQHELDMGAIKDLTPTGQVHPKLVAVARRIISARKQGATTVIMIGAHVLRSGVQRYLIDLIEKGYISAVAANGACAVHDFELALIGKTTESVAAYIRQGQFGLWEETGRINDIISEAARQGEGLGEAVGREISRGDYPHKDISLFAACYRRGIPATVHAGIGYDIVHEHPNCDGAAWGAASYRDFLRFAGVIERLENGVLINLGSAVMGPEVFLKALAMVRNAARQEGRQIGRFCTLVCDLHPLPEDTSSEPPKEVAGYYFRPWKTLLVRTVAEGGESHYVQASHEKSVPQLWTAINNEI